MNVTEFDRLYPSDNASLISLSPRAPSVTAVVVDEVPMASVRRIDATHETAGYRSCLGPNHTYLGQLGAPPHDMGRSSSGMTVSRTQPTTTNESKEPKTIYFIGGGAMVIFLIVGIAFAVFLGLQPDKDPAVDSTAACNGNDITPAATETPSRAPSSTPTLFTLTPTKSMAPKFPSRGNCFTSVTKLRSAVDAYLTSPDGALTGS